MFAKGIFNINAAHYSDEGIPFIRITDLKGAIIDESSLVYIPEEQNNLYLKTNLSYGDVILSKTAYPAASLVTLKSCNTSQDTIAMKLSSDSKIRSHFLTIFLNTKYGISQMQRWFTGNIQMHLNLKDSRNIIVPTFSTVFQNKIYQAFELSISLIKKSSFAVKEGQAALLSELGLSNWRPKHQLSFIKSFSDTQQADRIDAEYFQPKYDELLQAIEKNSEYLNRVSEMQTHNSRGLQPSYSSDGALDVVTSKHILENGLDFDNFEKTDISNWDDQKKARINKGDILTYTTGANIGRTAYYPLERHALASNHVNILRIKGEDPEYVGFIMNSLIGRLQTERMSAGSAQAELYPKDIEKFVIPFIAKGKQISIRNKVGESHSLRKRSKHLLDCAKRAVEIAIEQDESTAMQWLESQTGAIQ